MTTIVLTTGGPLLACDSVMKDVMTCGGGGGGEADAVVGGIVVEVVVKTIALVEAASVELGGVNVEKEVVVSTIVVGAATVLEAGGEKEEEDIGVEVNVVEAITVPCQWPCINPITVISTDLCHLTPFYI